MDSVCVAENIAFDADGNHNRFVLFLVNCNIQFAQYEIRCFPHIINIAIQTIVKELKENPSMVVIRKTCNY